MPPLIVKVQSPLKGINRVLGREHQPENSAYDALNVLPFDRYGRLRAAQRPGTAKLYTDNLGGSPIMAITQAVFVADPAFAVAATLLSEPFTYADATILHNVGGAATTWRASADATNVSGVGAVSANAVIIKGGFAVDNAIGAGPCVAGIYVPTLTFTNTWSVNATCRVLGTAASGGGNCAGLNFRVNKTTFAAAEGLTVQLFTDQVSIVNIATGTAIATATISPALTIGASVAITVYVNGDIFTVYVNGVRYILTTSSVASANVGVGIAIGINGSNVGASGVGGFTDYTVSSANVTPASRQSYLFFVTGGGVYYTDTTSSPALVSGLSTPHLRSGIVPGVAELFGQVYYVDGVTTAKALNIRSVDIEAWPGLDDNHQTIAIVGTETAASLGQYRLACAYRGRLVLAAATSAPQNFVMSRVGVPQDFDYSATDPAAAFAGNASTSGRIGDPITALMPFNDDKLLIGGDHTLWMVNGDPADGGSIDLISDAIGVLGANAWCKAPDGSIYFVGTGGMYRMGPQDAAPVNVSASSYPQFFAALNRSTNYITMAWDRDRQGLYVFVSPTSGSAGTHLWYDARTDSFWPQQFPANHGPVSVCVYDGDGPTDRTLYLGGTDAFIRSLNVASAVRSDSGTAISAYIVLGPFEPNDGGEAILGGVTFDFGELSSSDSGSPARWQATIQLRSGKTAYDVTEGTPTGTALVSWGRDRRTKTLRQRLKGQFFTIKISDTASDNYFTLESAWLEFHMGGRNRRQR